ncbi:A-kinase anchor protein 12 [Toxotes jaculatrix]|uniref:A-kinase anchor protein 12 n=1 Tax=Toxotes jaculatrix TaxID=941984 RepID=UPI001B3A8B52|nr:A-kinase anchor protein 12 [Toxotes jaculatrix]
MGDAQSAQRESKKDAAAEEESGKVDDARADQDAEDKPLKKNGQISEISGKADSTTAEVNGHCEDEIAAEAILSPDEDVSETTKPPKEGPLENVEINEMESPNEADGDKEIPLEITEMDAKQNDINESFRRFFSNIGLKLTVKRGSVGKAEITADVPDEAKKEESNRPEDIEDTAKETKSESAEQNIDLNAAQETYDNDSTTCPTLTDAPSEDVVGNAEEKATEAIEEAESDSVDAATIPPVDDDEKAKQDDTTDGETQPTSPSGHETEEVVSPIKRFFTTGIFSGLRKKKKPTEDDTTEKELVAMGNKETEETKEEEQQDKEEISLGVEAATVDTENKEKLKEEIVPAESAQTTDDGKTPSQEKVQASPLKRLLSGSSLKKLSKKQRGRKSSDAKLSDSGEHFSDQLVSPTQSAENQKEESPAQQSAEAGGEEDGAWASFKKLVSPNKRMKRSSLTNEETQVPGSAEETKPSEGEQISDHSTEEGKKRKDSSVSWEAVLCGSGRRRSRSRKTSDSEDETPQAENDNKKQASPLESSNEADETLASPPKPSEGSPSEGDGGSTWRSFKKLVTPKRKAKDEEESKDNIQSDSEVSQDDSSFSIKKLLPGRKKRKSAEKQDQVSSDEADKEVASGDEDSETPAVVPLSEFDTAETEVHIKTQADIESDIPKEADYELQQDLLDQMAERVPPCDSLQTEAKKVQDNEVSLENEASTSPASNKEQEDFTELISKHQQLSDIPEEGIITETMATPASVNEEAARDDTIAEDLIEITSEAITAQEPVDITLGDDTEMISAVSQLSESSNTSGNATPVPVEYDVKHAEAVLHQVVENISISPKVVPVCSDELTSQRIVGSVSHQILETFVKEDPTIMEIHRGSDATAINTGLNVQELDVINKLAATAQTESISEVNEAVSTEIVSEVPTDEFDTAEIALDEVHEVSISHPEESIKELESIDESQYVVESQSEVNEAVSIEKLPKGEEIIADEGTLVGDHEDEKAPPEIDSQEAESVATVAEESKEADVEQEVQTLTQKEDQILHDITDQVQVEDKDEPPAEVEELQELAAEQDATLDSEEGGAQLLEKEVLSEDIPAAETVTDRPKEEGEFLTEDNVEAKAENKLQAEAAKTERHVEESEVLEAVQRATLDSEEDSEEGRVQLPQGEEPSEDIPATETVTDEPKEETENITEVSAEPENKELKTDTPNIDDHQVAEVSEAMQEPILDSEEGSVQSLEKEIISEATPEAETITDKPKEETEPLIEVSEPPDALETECVQELEVLEATQVAKLDTEESSIQSLEKEVISEEIPPKEPITDELTQPTEGSAEPEKELSVEGATTEHVREPEVLLPDVHDIATEKETEVEAPMPANIVTESAEEGSSQELEKQILSEDVPKPDTEDIVTSVADETKSKVEAEQNEALKINGDQTTESTPHDVHVGEEDHIPEVVDELQTLTAVHVSSVNEEARSVQIREKTVFSEETPAPCVDNAAVTQEPQHGAHVSAVQASVEGQGVLPSPEIKSATVERAIVAEVTTCYPKDVSAVIPDVLIEKTSEVHEPLIDSVASEQDFKQTIETATPLVKDDVSETAEEGSVVMMMNVPSVQLEDNHRIEVQVVDVDIRSAEMVVDTTLEVGETEVKEVIDVCHETLKEVDKLSATSETEEKLISEENTVTIQEVIQHVKENVPETAPQPALDNLEQELIKQPDAVTEASEIAQSELSEVEDQKVMEDSIEPFRERQDEVCAVISDDSATEQQAFEDLKQAPAAPGSSDVSIHDRKEDLAEAKAEPDKSEADVTAEEVKLSSGELDVKKIHEDTQISQIAQSQIVTPSNAGLVVPQNTGIISSIGNVESPSSLSLEFKLNIQFGQTKAPASPPPTTERAEPVKKTEMSEVGVQAEEPEKQINPTQSAESQKQTELTEVAVQTPETTEPEPANIDSTERAGIMTQPLLLNVCMQAMETVEPVEQIKATERVTPNVQATETIQRVRQAEKREVFLSKPLLSEMCHQETQAEDPVKQTEEENDQDVWMDAEEDIYTQAEVSPHEVEEPQEHQTESDQAGNAGHDDEFEMAPTFKTEEDESQQEMIRTEGTCEIESEGEDFAVALEHQETATANITEMEWD